jgi:hypothetical protein
MGRRTRGLGSWVCALALTMMVAACGSDGGETTVEADATPVEVAEVAGLQGVRSGVATVSLNASKLKTKESMTVSLSGSFKRLEDGEEPQIALVASSQGRWNDHTIDFSSRAVLADGGTVSYGKAGKEQLYEVEAPTLDELRSKLDQASTDAGQGDVGACAEAAEGADLSRLLRNPEVEGRREEADGTKVVLVAGDLEISRLRELLVELARDPSCGAQMKALGLPPAAQLEAARVDFKNGFGPRLTAAVDRHGVIRGLTTRFECARLNGELFELQFDFGLNEVNQGIEISGSPEGEPLDNLLRMFGTRQEAVLRAEGEEVLIGLLEGLGDAMTGRLP